MTIAVYPPELPLPTRTGFSISRGDARARFAAGAGPMISRRRLSAVVDVVSWTSEMTRAELAKFDRFYREDLAQGSKPFLLADPSTDGWALLTDDGQPLYTDDGQPMLAAETWIVQFGGRQPSISAIPNRVDWRVDIELEVLPA